MIRVITKWDEILKLIFFILRLSFLMLGSVFMFVVKFPGEFITNLKIGYDIVS